MFTMMSSDIICWTVGFSHFDTHFFFFKSTVYMTLMKSRHAYASAYRASTLECITNLKHTFPNTHPYSTPQSILFFSVLQPDKLQMIYPYTQVSSLILSYILLIHSKYLLSTWSSLGNVLDGGIIELNKSEMNSPFNKLEMNNKHLEVSVEIHLRITETFKDYWFFNISIHTMPQIK